MRKRNDVHSGATINVIKKFCFAFGTENANHKEKSVPRIKQMPVVNEASRSERTSEFKYGPLKKRR